MALLIQLLLPSQLRVYICPVRAATVRLVTLATAAQEAVVAVELL
jgi:hypothetical protein